MADDSILTKTKKMLGIEEDYPAFDVDVIIYINSVFARLTQLGIGPEQGYMIEDKEAQWSEYLNNAMYLNSVKTYMYMRVRLMFDPPATSFALAAIEKQILEEEWRLSLYAPKANYGEEPVAPNVPGSYIGDGQWNLTGGLDFPARAQIGDIGIDYVSGNVWRKES